LQNLEWKRYLLVTLTLALLVLVNQGCVLAVEPLAGVTLPDLPGIISFSEGPVTYNYPLKDWGLEVAYNWEYDKFSGYLLVCTDEEKLRQGIAELAGMIDVPARDASFAIDEQGQLVIKPASRGRILDQEALYQALTRDSVYRKIYSLIIKDVEPALTEAELQAQQPDTLWAVYSTVLTNIPDRTENVRLASAFLDGLLLAPGQVFSFNETVGPREMARGFRYAMVISGGSFEPGLGGGVCQVSSTLYNTVLLAGLEIVERHNHSVRIAYVPIGRDATVLYGSKDFKFKNNTPGFIMLKTKLEGLKLEIAVYGKGPKPFDQVQISSRVLKNIPAPTKTYQSPALAPGERKLVEKGQSGYISETYRQLTKGSQVINELLSRDYYAPQPNIYAEGKETT